MESGHGGYRDFTSSATYAVVEEQGPLSSSYAAVLVQRSIFIAQTHVTYTHAPAGRR